jgi:hypothetical protein
MWDLNLVPSLPPYDTQFDPELLKQVGESGVAEFVRAATLRSHAELDHARAVAELWHWRSRTRQIQEEGYHIPEGTPFRSFEELVRFSASQALEAGDIPDIIDGDFPAMGKAYRDLTDNEWSVVRSITIERHFAFNWLSGYAPRNSWQETPTDT